MKQKKQTILEWYRKNHNDIDAPCDGKGDCGRCKIRFMSDAPEAGEKERRLLTEEELKTGIRLACETEKTEGDDIVPVGEIFRMWGTEAITEVSLESHEIAAEGAYGIALDLGTTTLAMRLVGLKSGKGWKTISSVNHQRAYGADVITRIQAANEGQLQALQACIQNDILDLLVKLTTDAGVSTEQVKKIVIAGNTTMCHLLLGYSCESLGRAPFTPVDVSLRKISLEQLFEKIESDAKKEQLMSRLQAEVVILPGISAFVGADIVAGMYDCDLDLKDNPHMLLDVGTNGEIVIGDKHGFTVTSTAAGPVFEGGNISCGVPAVKGAVAHVRWNGKAELETEVLGASKPQMMQVLGVCGSGLVDLMAALVDAKIVDENGTLADEYFEDGYFMDIDSFAGSKRLWFRQSDIRELQMGKAAIRAGIELVTANKKPEKIYLAGGFGAAIDVNSAVQIGLFPKESKDIVTSAGNTSLEGAHKFLLDKKGEERVQNIVRNATEIRLAEEAGFEEKYIQYMQF